MLRRRLPGMRAAGPGARLTPGPRSSAYATPRVGGRNGWLSEPGTIPPDPSGLLHLRKAQETDARPVARGLRRLDRREPRLPPAGGGGPCPVDCRKRLRACGGDTLVRAVLGLRAPGRFRRSGARLGLGVESRP